jgi:hypothetical protein
MTTRLDGPLKRELTIAGTDYTLTITQQGLTLALKGKRKGLDLEWNSLISGDAALATALNASLTAPLDAAPASASRGGRTRPKPH